MKYLFPFVLPTVLRARPFGKYQRLFPAPMMAGWLLALALMTAGNLRAAAPPTSLQITNTGMDSEGLQTFRLEWNALSNATYLVQSADSLAPGSPWHTLDAVQFPDTVGSYQFQVVAADYVGQPSPARFFRLTLPQTEIFSVEPAILAPGVAADLYIIGQCFGSNDVLRINGVDQTNLVFFSSTLLSRPTFTPGTPGTYVFELVVAGQVRSSFTITVADPLANPELVLQGPPEEPPASPAALIKTKTKSNQSNDRVVKTKTKSNQSNDRVVKTKTKSNQSNDRLAGGRGLLDEIRENDTVTFDVQDGKKGLNAVNVCRVDSWTSIFERTAGGDDCDDNDPAVIPFSGEIVQQIVDLAVEGRGLDFVWSRTYHSRLGRFDTTANGWTFSYDVRCAQNSSGGMDVYDGTGRKDAFKLQTNGVYSCLEFFREGTLTGGVFRLTFADTGYWEFNPLDGSGTAGRLAHIVDRNGNTMSLNYDTSARLAQIVDDLGRTNTVAYNSSGRVAGVTDFSGRTVTYQYFLGLPGEPGGPGDLASVTSPPVTGTPNGNDFPFGKTTAYTYSTGFADDRENHLLLSVLDANRQITYKHVYQHNQTDLEFLRCISVQRWTNSPTVLSYLPQSPTPTNQFAALRCVINDPVGNVTECFYDTRNRPVKTQEFTGRATPGVPVTATLNRPKNKLRSNDPDYYECGAEWNNDSLCTRARMPRGDHASFVYESDFDKSTRARKRADLRVERQIATTPVDLDGDGLADTTELVSRYDYDPRFGSGRTARKAKTSEATINVKKIYEGARAFNVTKRNAITATQQNEAAAMKALVETAVARGTIKVCFAAGPRQTTSQDGTFSHKVNQTAGENCDNGLGNNFVISATDPRGNVTLCDYDANGNLKTVRPKVKHNPFQLAQLSIAWNPNGQPVAVTNFPDANGYSRVDTFTYNTSGPQAGYLQSIAIDESGVHLTTTFECDSRGNVTRCIDPRGNDWKFHNNALNQCLRVETPTNLVARCITDYFYDANDNLVQRSTELRDAADNFITNRVAVSGFDRLHRLTRFECAVDATHSLTNDFVYDGNDQCVLALGGDAVSGVDPHQTVSFLYDERGLLFQESFASGSPDQSTSQYDYDPDGNLTRVSEGLEGTPSISTIDYDGFAGFASRNAVQGLVGSIPFSGRLRPTAAPYALMRLSSSSSQADCKSKETCGNGVQMRARLLIMMDTSGSMNRISKITDPMGNVTTFNFDASDNLKVIRHFGQTNDVPGTNGNIRLAESRYEYDELDRCVRSRDLFFDVSTQAPIGDGERTTTIAYALNGECTSVTDDLGRVTSYTYDTVGWPASVSGPGGKTITVTVRDAVGNVTRTTQTDISDLGGAPQVFAWTNVYDSLNRCVRTTDNVGNSSHCAYDSLGRVTVLFNPKEYSIKRTYDLLGRCTLAVQDLDGDGLFDLTHDISSSFVWSSSSGRLLASADSHGNTTSYGYDSLSRCTSITNADGTRLSLVWSPRSNLIQETDANGTVVIHTYDQNDRCISNAITPGSGVALSTTFEIFCYDGASRLVAATNDSSHSEFAYDSRGNCTRGTSGGLGALTTYDSKGNRLSLTYPGGRALTYAYDSLDQCTNIVESGTSLASFAFDGPGRVARIAYGNGMRTRILYDGISGLQNAPGDFGHAQVSSMRHALAGGLPVVSDVSLTWDRNQNKASRSDAIFAPAVPRTNAMTLAYDPADRLTHAMVFSGSTLLRDTQYGLDRMGNRTNVSGAATCSGDYFMDGTVPAPMDFQMNQYTTTACDSRTYDDNGNLASRGSAAGPVTWQYDYANRLVLVQALDFNTGSLAPVASYAYDALGRRIAKTVYGGGGLPPVTTQFVFDGESVIEERVSGAVSASFVLDGTRSHDDGIIQMQHNGQSYYYHTDDQGNVLALTSTGGAVAERYDYDDFGAVTFLTSDGVPTTAKSSSVGNVYCWGGLRLDSETGLQCDDGAGYLETASGRSLARAQDDLQRTGSIVQLLTRNNPWSGSGLVAMKTGTVKFFNETKGFGRMKASRNMTLKGQKILQNRMAGGGYWGETPDPGSDNVVVGNFVGTVASANSAVTAR